MTSIEKTLIEIENEIKQIKTKQLTQSDSYKFYKIYTENLYSASRDGKLGIITFTPYRQDNMDNILCEFHIWAPTGRAYASWMSTDAKNPFVTYIRMDTSSYSVSSPKEVYVCCYSNSDGFLQIEWK